MRRNDESEGGAAEAGPGRAEAEAVLHRYWGHPGFREGQWEVIAPSLAGRDVLGILPTGGGKSVCYQVPALLSEGFTLVISPLIALMQDQVAGLKARGIPAAFINSTLSAREVDQRWTDAEFGRYRLLYVAPERLSSELFLARAERLSVTHLAVDEAHCVSEWGPHFRPSYLEIADARARLGHPPMTALTATATPDVRRDILEHLALRAPEVVVKGFDRPNLVWSIFRDVRKRTKVREVIEAVQGSGIVYAATRRAVEEWAAWLTAQGETAAAYHGGMRAEDRAAIQAAWVGGETRLMVATNAFGMGIDKPDVRFVIHVDLPGTLEGYYQEAGRGGRDGERAYAVLLVHPGDVATQWGLIERGHPEAADVRKVYDAICNLAQIPLGTLPDTPVPVVTEAVTKLTGLPGGTVRMALEMLMRQEVWQVQPPRKRHGHIRFDQPAEAVRRYADALDNRTLAGFIDALLRTVHGDAFSDWWEIDMRLVQRRTGLDPARLTRGLTFLQERGLLRWRGPDSAVHLLFNEPRTRHIPIDDVGVRRARRRAEARLRDMQRYARSVTCRRHFLLMYFGEPSPPACGRCDICLGRHEAIVITPEDEPLMRTILAQVADGRARDDWFETPPAPEPHLDALTDWLVQEGYLIVPNPLEEAFALTEKAHEMMAQWTPRAS